MFYSDIIQLLIVKAIVAHSSKSFTYGSAEHIPIDGLLPFIATTIAQPLQTRLFLQQLPD